jgi:hypothetical protein
MSLLPSFRIRNKESSKKTVEKKNELEVKILTRHMHDFPFQNKNGQTFA